MFGAIENAGQLENIFMFIVKFWLPPQFSEIIFHHLLEDIKTKKKKKTHPKPPHPTLMQPRLRTNPTTEFGKTMIESDRQRRVPQLPPFLDYFSISLIEWPMLQRWDPATHATIELLMTPPSHQLICFSLYNISHVIVNLVFSFFFFFSYLVFLLWICWLCIFFFRILWVNGEFFVEGFFLSFFPKWVKHLKMFFRTFLGT